MLTIDCFPSLLSPFPLTFNNSSLVIIIIRSPHFSSSHSFFPSFSPHFSCFPSSYYYYFFPSVFIFPLLIIIIIFPFPSFFVLSPLFPLIFLLFFTPSSSSTGLHSLLPTKISPHPPPSPLFIRKKPPPSLSLPLLTYHSPLSHTTHHDPSVSPPPSPPLPSLVLKFSQMAGYFGGKEGKGGEGGRGERRGEGRERGERGGG